MSDYAHRETDKQLAALEKQITDVYKQTSDDVSKTVKDYFTQFAERDKKEQARLENGEITQNEYNQWRLAQIGRGERYQAMRDKLAERYTNANEVAVSYVNDATPGIYSLNRNYSAYTIEQTGADVDFTLYDESTVKRLITEEPDLMPNYPEAKAIRRGIDLAYGKQQITASVTSSILQGKSVYKIADDLQKRMETMNRESAVRTARTAFTEAENAGRQDTYVAAAEMGIDLQKEWVATFDDRTRPEHSDADGQVVDYDQPFNVGGEKMMYPGDSSGSGWNVYNCRCCTIAKVKKVNTSNVQRWSRDPLTNERGNIADMQYWIWYDWRTKSEDVTAKYISNANAGSGTISYGKGYRISGHSNEIAMANWIHDNFGGDITLLTESKAKSQETADFLWNGSLWDLKNVSSEKSVDSALRKGIHQIADNPGGIILNCEISISDRTEANMVHRVRRSSKEDIDIMIFKNDELEKIIECKK